MNIYSSVEHEKYGGDEPWILNTFLGAKRIKTISWVVKLLDFFQ